ncbi:DUF4350 domain-containing protein [Herbiconiux daphne]|uniref:DUF4350 domain-containing protein n=1 Tax=Herbiconiux daphne TaxID=2970914 RepID=A0ABT2H4S0_9MICO|nr:DUF4350 domain-containing protein [Herbiconiux daphne]MCS5734931.1 DUF4350 domain-containing protein [Herbiconiux daphne]
MTAAPPAAPVPPMPSAPAGPGGLVEPVGPVGSGSPGAAAVTASAVAETPRLRTTARRWLFWVVVVVAAVVFAVISVLLTASGAPDAERFSIGSAGPSGSEAVAEVLRQQGVDVVAAGTMAEAVAAVDAADGDATVLFIDPYGYLDDDQLGQVGGLGSELVLVEPGSAELSVFAPAVAPAGAAEEADAVDAGCRLPAAERAGDISRPTATYRMIDAGADSVTCFRSYDDAFGVVQVPGDADAGSGSGSDSGTVTVFGAGDALTNDGVLLRGNAALSLGVLGTHPTLVWYMPTYADVAGGPEPTIGELTPGWVTPVILLLLVVVVAAGVWRGRRFGPVVVENLPVTVRASETMEGRARLYAKQSAHVRALDALRIGTISRLTVALALPRHASVVDVSRAVASVTGLPVDQVHDTLVGALPRSEADLLALSDRLLVLEQAVHRATHDGPPATSSPSG